PKCGDRPSHGRKAEAEAHATRHHEEREWAGVTPLPVCGRDPQRSRLRERERTAEGLSSWNVHCRRLSASVSAHAVEHLSFAATAAASRSPYSGYRCVFPTVP